MSRASSSETVVRVREVSKRFDLNRTKQRTLMELFTHPLKRVGPEGYFWPVKDVSFELARGATLGFIGENGAGKSTILKLIARILEPTSGWVETRGRVAALLELGAGFHPDLTGRDNIYLNGSIMGLNRHEINRHLARIIEFADIGPFIDSPVKHYSSGMRVRLGFSVAVHVQPDVMLVDEVLAVGDEDFQHKCLQAFYDFLREGGTLILVSHNAQLIRDMCHRTIWLDDGVIKADGPSTEVLANYLNHIHSKERDRLLHEREATHETEVQSSADAGQARGDVSVAVTDKGTDTSSTDEQATAAGQPGRTLRWGDNAIRIDAVRVLDRESAPCDFFFTGDPFTVELDYTVQRPLTEAPVIGIALVRHDGLWCYGTNTQIDEVSARHICEPGHRRGTVVISFDALQLLPGVYFIDLALQNLHGGDHDYYHSCARLSVRSLVRDTGVARLAHEWHFMDRPG
jgi:ABC-type polysaccharide/polyol phosphate transport system ATPase subunit